MASGSTEVNQTKFLVQCSGYGSAIRERFCEFMEKQLFVDVTITCGSFTVRGHRFLLAASSSYFREQFEQTPDADQIIINNIDYVVFKEVLNYIYVGEVTVTEDLMPDFIFLSHFFKIKGLNQLEIERFGWTDNKQRPKPIIYFQSKYAQERNGKGNTRHCRRSYINCDCSRCCTNPNPDYKLSLVPVEANVALEKEEVASRKALEQLRKELAGSSGTQSLVVEEAFSETTVETNFTSQGNMQLKMMSDGLEGDLPIVYKNEMGTYFNITDEAFKMLSTDGAIEYQIVENPSEAQSLYENTILEPGNSPMSDNLDPLVQLVATTNHHLNELRNREIDLPKDLGNNYENFSCTFQNPNDDLDTYLKNMGATNKGNVVLPSLYKRRGRPRNSKSFSLQDLTDYIDDDSDEDYVPSGPKRSKKKRTFSLSNQWGLTDKELQTLKSYEKESVLDTADEPGCSKLSDENIENDIDETEDFDTVMTEVSSKTCLETDGHEMGGSEYQSSSLNENDEQIVKSEAEEVNTEKVKVQSKSVERKILPQRKARSNRNYYRT